MDYGFGLQATSPHWEVKGLKGQGIYMKWLLTSENMNVQPEHWLWGCHMTYDGSNISVCVLRFTVEYLAYSTLYWHCAIQTLNCHVATMILVAEIAIF